MFDEESVMDQVTEVFWRQGYANTSVSDLVEATGVHKPSLYRVFGNKEEMFARVLHRYLGDRLEMFSSIISESGPGVDGIHAFLDRLRQDLSSGAIPSGCLLVSSSTELCGSTPGFDGFGRAHRDGLRERVRVLVGRAEPSRAEAIGSVATDSATVGADVVSDITDRRTDLFVMFMLGLDVTIRGGADQDEIGRALDSMHATVETWRSRVQ